MALESYFHSLSLQMHAAFCLLRGDVAAAVDNRRVSKDWYLRALHADPLSYDAFHHLTSAQIVTAEEEIELVEELREIKGWESVPWIMDFYGCIANKYDVSKSKEKMVGGRGEGECVIFFFLTQQRRRSIILFFENHFLSFSLLNSFPRSVRCAAPSQHGQLC